MLQPRKNKVTIVASKPQPTGNIVAPTSESIQYTEKNAESREGRKKGGFYKSETEGVKVDEKGNSTAKPFSRKVIVSPGGHTRIIGDDGTVISEGPARSSTIKDALKETARKVKITNEQREKNARGNNLIGGSAENITQEEVDRLNAAKQATGNALDPKIVAAAKREKDLREADDRARKGVKVIVKKRV